ncbi:TIGR04283 family arsenosugar biosynthesis glycosyltransferase [Litoribaculum gwangyangense]|uniref:TIGR04283 family arsenosugar biosynthesis glycosyltransferase n=1 Tax=Litoribaculum gwangyangense TaxID=1130722 RepID=A0ABP9C5Y1_9FLAO
MNKISIIIPILNEETFIGKLIAHLLENSSKKNIAEIIVVDGGSNDNSKDIVTKFVTSSDSETSELYREVNKRVLDMFSQSENTRTDIKLIHSEKGRAKQMNFGAKNACGNILYFLHADSLPPKHFDDFIINEVQKGHEAGCFKMQFDSNHWWLKLVSWFTQFKWRACRGGDQSQFITKTLFDDIGGFDEQYIIYEDNILINELYKRKQFVVINKTITTSARLYKKHGIFKLQFYYLNIYLKRWLGADANEIYGFYKKKVC